MSRIATFAAWFWAAMVTSFATADQVVIEMRPEVTVSRPLVLVRDIAVLRGGTTQLREAIANLDLVLLNDATFETEISRRLIQVRLLVAAQAEDAVRFTGAPSTHVILQSVVQTGAAFEPSSPAETISITDGLIEERLEMICAQSLGQELADVDVHLSQPVAAQALRGLEQRPVELQIVPGPGFAPGSNSVTLQFWQSGELIRTVSTRIEIVVTQPTMVLNRFVPRGTVITEEMVTQQHRPVGQSGILSQPQDVVGSEAVRDLDVGTVLSGNMIRLARQVRPQPAVKNRDLVFVTYSIPGLNLSLADAVAMQDGQVGEVVRVMNPTSRQVISAVVVAPGHVQVQPANFRGGSR